MEMVAEKKQLNSIASIVKTQKEFFAKGISLDPYYRKSQLSKLKDIIVKNESEICKALNHDLGKHTYEALFTEIAITEKDFDFMIKNVLKFTKPKKVPNTIFNTPGKSRIYNDPYGSVLIIAPWNYPYYLLMSPLAGAMAAGNTTILKPSEYAIATSKLVTKLINDNFDPGYLHVVEGAVEETKQLLNEKWDYIFFTGSTNVGKIVYEAAAKNLTPVTLELGGKSPCIVHKDANLSEAAKRIMWGKFINSGQTCIAPDYIYAHKDIKDKFIDECKSVLKGFYGDNPLESESYGKIISERHFNRLQSFINQGNVVIGGKTNSNKLKIEPTLLTNVSKEAPVMKEEIFGPILPIFDYQSIDEVTRYIKENDKPLATYVFTKDFNIKDNVLNSTSSGGACVNDTVLHISSKHLPFGGVGGSGIGAYHGKSSFTTFSHQKSVLDRGSNPGDNLVRFAPYNMKRYNLMKWMSKWFL